MIFPLKVTTLHIDVDTATKAELDDALSDCTSCLQSEYPETPEGCGRAERLAPKIRDALARRFPPPPLTLDVAHFGIRHLSGKWFMGVDGFVFWTTSRAVAEVQLKQFPLSTKADWSVEIFGGEYK